MLWREQEEDRDNGGGGEEFCVRGHIWRECHEALGEDRHPFKVDTVACVSPFT